MNTVDFTGTYTNPKPDPKRCLATIFSDYCKKTGCKKPYWLQDEERQ